MRCAVALLACAGCSPPEARPEPPPPIWVYAPAAMPVLGEPIARIGRSQPPQHVRSLGIAGTIAKVPLRLATPWAVPGEGAARALVYGMEGARSAIELIDVDAGRVVWRDNAACAGPVVGVTADAIVCADANGVRGVGLDGKAKWKVEQAFVAMTEDRVVMAGADEVVVLDAASGDEISRVKLPAGVTSDSVLASCGDAGRELFVAGQDGKLARVAEAKGGPAVAWAIPLGRIDAIDACTGDVVIVREAGVGGGALLAIERASGKLRGRVDDVLGYWRARDGSERIEVATTGGVRAWPRDLVGESQHVLVHVLGELLAERGELRLVRASPTTAVVLDRAGVRAYVPFAAMGAVLGDDAIVAASWTGAADTPVRRIGLPPRYRKELRLPGTRPPVAPPAELRDLPEVTPLRDDAVIAKPDTGMHGVLDVAIDPREGAVLYTLHVEGPDDERGTPGIAALDLAARAWRWQRARACGTGEAVGIAVARDVIACATRARGVPAATIVATTRDGAARWEWETDHLDRIDAAGEVVLAFDADRLVVLDAASGKPRWHVISDDGARVRAAAVALATGTIVVAYERNRVVARTLAGFPLWSIAVDGHVASIGRSAAGVLVTLEDGDAYRIALPDGDVHAMPGLNLEWRPAGDLVTASAPGGPIPGVPAPPAVAAPGRRPFVRRPVRRRPPPTAEDERPRLWTPIPPPPPLGDSWQLTLYELTGGLRARNDYGLFPPIAQARERGPAGSPIVVASSPGLVDVLVIDPRTGDPLRRVRLGEDVAPGLVFGTIVDGTPTAGAVLQGPLRVVVF